MLRVVELRFLWETEGYVQGLCVPALALPSVKGPGPVSFVRDDSRVASKACHLIAIKGFREPNKQHNCQAASVLTATGAETLHTQ